MRTYILRRVVISIPLMLGLLTFNFFIIKMAPGNPIDLFESPDMTPEVRERIRKAYGLDQPLHVQFYRYVSSVVIDRELGYSIPKRRNVIDEISDALPNTLKLSFLALLLDLGLGIAIGIISAVKQYSAFDNTVRIGALTLYSMPSFYLGLMMLLLFSGGVWYILPAGGTIDAVNHGSMTGWEKIWDHIVHMILPIITLGVGSAAATSRYMRGQLLETIRQDYVRTARAKGLHERTVIFKHALRNALMPIVTITGLSLPALLSGSVIVEYLFSWPGMGRVAVEAASQRDMPIFLAVNLMFAGMVVIGSLLADILYAVVDPRVRLN